jgi:Fe-S-cluster containining protein
MMCMRLKYPLEVFFECIKCGLCCRDTEHHRRKVFLTPRDVENIVSLTHKSPREFCRATHAAPRPFSRVIKKTSGSCPFLDENSMCTIYDSRPLICRCYPFIVDYEGTDLVAFTTSSRECPGLRRGRRLPEEFFEKLAQEVTTNFESCAR